jgi:hypothetical protein
VIYINPSKFAVVWRKPDYPKRSPCRLNVREGLRVIESRRIEVGPERDSIVFTQERSPASTVHDITHLGIVNLLPGARPNTQYVKTANLGGEAL